MLVSLLRLKLQLGWRITGRAGGRCEWHGNGRRSRAPKSDYSAYRILWHCWGDRDNMNHSHIARLILTNKRWSGNVPDPYRKEGRREGLPSSWTGQRMDFSITFSSPPPHRWAGKNKYWNIFPGHKLALLYENVILTPIHSHMGKVHFAYNKRPENRCVLVCPRVPSCEVGKKTTLILCRREWISSVVFSGRRASERFPEFCTCEVGRENYTKNSFSAAGPAEVELGHKWTFTIWECYSSPLISSWDKPGPVQTFNDSSQYPMSAVLINIKGRG